ncbi:MAG: hydrogenase [Steroidobacteraceae bacterium]
MDRASQSHQLTLIGVGLLLVAVLVGVIVSYLAVPRLALSAHLVGILQGILLLVLGLLWDRLNLTRAQSALAFWLAVYQAAAAFLSNLLAAVLGAGNSVIPMAAGAAHGTTVQETIITVGLRSAGAALIIFLLLLLWGLRRAPAA